jgi:hypothetical protein
MNRRFYFPWTVGLPIVALIGVTCFAMGEQLIAKWRYQREINSLVAVNQPVDSFSLRTRFYQSTSQSQTMDRLSVDAACQAMDNHDTELWPGESHISLPLRQPLIPQGEAWPERVLFEHYVNQRKSILSELSRLEKAAVPTWQFLPCSRQGLILASPGLPRLKSLLLDAEFLLAVHDHDSERALRALEIHDSVINAQDVQVSIAMEVDRVLARDHNHTRIIQSLRWPTFWSPEQLVRLELLVVDDKPLADRWRTVLSAERAMSLGAVDTKSGWLTGSVTKQSVPTLLVNERPIPATSLVRFIHVLNGLLPLADHGYEELFRRAWSASGWVQRDITGWIPLNTAKASKEIRTALQYLTPQVHDYAIRLVSLEDIRRRARLAIGLRRYAKTHGRWPERLSELQAFGLSADDLQTVSGTEFKVESDGKSLTVLGNQSLPLFSLDT